MKATLAQIKNAIETQAIKRLAGQSLPVKTAYWLGRTLDAAAAEYDRIQRANLDLVKKHGGQEVREGFWQIPPDKPELNKAYFEEYGELMSAEVEITGRQLTLDELEGVSISAGDLMALSFLVAEPKEGEGRNVTDIQDKIESRKQRKAKA